MAFLKKTVLPIVLSAVWISASEFLRNNILLKSYWVEHYEALGLTFPSDPTNGAIWVLWSLLFSIAIFVVSQRFNLIETTFLSWFVVFVLMWVVIGNLGVLPSGLLISAVPLSLIETYVAALIIVKVQAIDTRKPEPSRDP